MTSIQRHAQIVALTEARGFISVKELADSCGVSEVTIRRDLEQLDHQGRLRRTYGGAFAIRLPAEPPSELRTAPAPAAGGSLVDRVDVLVATPVDPTFDRALLDRAATRGIPVIAESAVVAGAYTLVAVDNFQAGMALGRWAGSHAAQREKPVRVLDLGYHLDNTRARSRGFLAGLREILPAAEIVLSINTQSTRQSAYQLTSDVLDVHGEINMIFAINDATAWGAWQACEERGIPPDAMTLLTFGLEGDTLRAALASGSYCSAGLAMFPEIVGPVCVEAAVAAFQGRPLPAQLVTPHAVLTPETLPQYYTQTAAGWQFNWEMAFEQLHLPLSIDHRTARTAALPRRIGFVVPFSEHEWYRSLARCMQSHAAHLGIELEIVDAEENLREDVTQREREIARAAAELVAPGDVILIDGGGAITTYLAEELACRENVTVITNALPVLQALHNCPGVTLLATGGLLRRGHDTFSGPTAEQSLRDLRADKLFLTATGITPDFGLSHGNLAEVATKQAMIRAAREVILLADHTKFGQEAVAQIAPLNAVSRLITDNALVAGTRLSLTQMGIEVIIARALPE
jgi:DeoR/GlpR family transcriptional regulator of sugar metabolism